MNIAEVSNALALTIVSLEACAKHKLQPDTVQDIVNTRLPHVKRVLTQLNLELNDTQLPLTDKDKVFLIRNSTNWTTLQLIEEVEAVLKAKP